MEHDTRRMRGGRPYVFADTLRRRGLDEIVRFLEEKGGLARECGTPPDRSAAEFT
jgi:urease accessory protein